MTMPSLVDQLANRIIRDLSVDTPSPLPRIGEWASRYGVSYRTMWKAAQRVAQQGLIAMRRGSPPRRSDDSGTHGLTRAQTVQHQRLAALIIQGHYKAGNPLPKLDFLQIEGRVSRANIVAALRRLAEENLVHKSGRNWVVGPRLESVASKSVAVASWPVVLLLVGAELDWENIATNHFLQPFMELFRSELGKQGFCQQVHYTTAPLQPIAALMASGRPEARRIINKLGDRYRGAITFDTGLEPEDFSLWARELTRNGSKPFIHFDSSGTHPHFSRATLSLPNTCYRLFLDEPAAVRLVLQTLHAVGHRRIGVLSYRRGSTTWEPQRIERIRAMAAQSFPDCQIHSQMHTEKFWLPDALRVDNRLGMLARRFGAFEEERKGAARKRGVTGSSYLAKAPSVARILQAGCTAIVALNDWRALQYLVLLRNAGMRVPEDMSIVSFDNVPESETIPISTVDFGFAKLGYLAAHILIGDMPVRANRNGDIGGICALMDRGSIGRHL